MFHFGARSPSPVDADRTLHFPPAGDVSPNGDSEASTPTPRINPSRLWKNLVVHKGSYHNPIEVIDRRLLDAYLSRPGEMVRMTFALDNGKVFSLNVRVRRDEPTSPPKIILGDHATTTCVDLTFIDAFLDKSQTTDFYISSRFYEAPQSCLGIDLTPTDLLTVIAWFARTTGHSTIVNYDASFFRGSNILRVIPYILAYGKPYWYHKQNFKTFSDPPLGERLPAMMTFAIRTLRLTDLEIPGSVDVIEEGSKTLEEVGARICRHLNQGSLPIEKLVAELQASGRDVTVEVARHNAYTRDCFEFVKKIQESSSAALVGDDVGEVLQQDYEAMDTPELRLLFLWGIRVYSDNSIGVLSVADLPGAFAFVQPWNQKATPRP